MTATARGEAATGVATTGVATTGDVTTTAGLSPTTGIGAVAGVTKTAETTRSSVSISGTAPALEGNLILGAPEIAADGAVTVTGAGAPGAAVEILVDDEPVGSALVDDAGTWLLTIQQALALMRFPHRLWGKGV
ncbi:MAG: hypothetical protein IPK16_17335 [Anaerolineales bacterium]|nr:hypothetical protein [Anaerolineales bacterium]